MTPRRECLILVVFIIVSSITAFAHFNLGYSQQPLQTSKLVHAGGGNSTSPVVAFVPQEINIKAGESVTWDNPTPVAEPHSVSFLRDNRYFPDFAAPFTVKNSTEFQSLVPNSNAEPLFVPVPGQDPQTKTVVLVNSRAFIPVVIDSTGKNVTYLPPNGNYSMTGTEQYLNSGWLWPPGQAPPGGPAITRFTVAFEKPGTYGYVCNVHPWMAGKVIVSPK